MVEHRQPSVYACDLCGTESPKPGDEPAGWLKLPRPPRKPFYCPDGYAHICGPCQGRPIGDLVPIGLAVSLQLRTQCGAPGEPDSREGG